MSIVEQIAALKEKRAAVKGETTEVYTRITGYYRPLKAWNPGKRSEYRDRQEYDADSPQPVADVARRELYTRASCPGCVVAKRALDGAGVDVQEMDTDWPEGFARANTMSVFATPTLIEYDADDREVARHVGAEEIAARTLRDQETA